MLAQLFLKENGYRVVTTADGSEAQQVAAQISGPIDLLLTDVVMPGINGRVLAERLALSPSRDEGPLYVRIYGQLYRRSWSP